MPTDLHPAGWLRPGRLLLYALVLTLCASNLRAETLVPAGPEGPNTEALIQKLRSDDPDERDAARRKLNEAGEAMREALEKALAAGGKDPDFAAQVKQILKELGQNAVLKRFDAPKVADFDFTAKPIKEVLTAFKETYGWQVIAAEAAREKPCTFAVKGATFFQALEALRQAARLGYKLPEEADEEAAKRELPFELVELGEKGAVFAQALGPFLVFTASTTVQRSKHADYLQGTAAETLSLNWEAFLVAEPGLQAGSMRIRHFKFEDAKESKVADLNVNLDDTTGAANEKRAHCFTFAASGTPDAAFASPFNIRASLSAQVPLKLVTKRIELAGAAGKTFTVKDGTLVYEKLHQEGGEWKIHFKTTGTVSELHSSGLVENDGDEEGTARTEFAPSTRQENEEVPKNRPGIYFVDAQNHVIDSQGQSLSGGNESWTAVISLPKEPTAIVLQALEEKVEKKYELLLKGITMP
ncbi:MAG: hypothetical protein HY291_02065 [Planctomycetes bacterium]|nr:hypothetical protein [Planctomycetota bacterium]